MRGTRRRSRTAGRPCGCGRAAAALIPDAHEARPAVAVEEVRVGEVEALHVDDADEHALAVVVRLGRAEALRAALRRPDLLRRDDGRRHRQRLAHLDVGDLVPGGNVLELAERDGGGHEVGLARLLAHERALVDAGVESLDEDAGEDVMGELGELALLRLDLLAGLRHGVVAEHPRRLAQQFLALHADGANLLRADRQHPRAGVGEHAQLGLALAQVLPAHQGARWLLVLLRHHVSSPAARCGGLNFVPRPRRGRGGWRAGAYVRRPRPSCRGVTGSPRRPPPARRPRRP